MDETIYGKYLLSTVVADCVVVLIVVESILEPKICIKMQSVNIFSRISQILILLLQNLQDFLQ